MDNRISKGVVGEYRILGRAVGDVVCTTDDRILRNKCHVDNRVECQIEVASVSLIKGWSNNIFGLNSA